MIIRYVPCSEQEERDRAIILEALERCPKILTRENPICHMTASAWVVNKDRTKVLMVYHNIYQSWSWCGGHADGETDLAAVALREAEEETGVSDLRLLSDDPISLEILTVERHVRRGEMIAPHLHFNLTFLIEANEDAVLVVKPDENTAVRWYAMGDAIKACSEPKMVPIYEKLNQKVWAFQLA